MRQTVDYFKGFIAWMLDIVFPIHCIGCGTLTIKHPYLCAKCFSSLTVLQSGQCICCKTSSVLGMTCLPCRKQTDVDQLLIVAPYDQPLLEKIITTYKYRFIPSLDGALFALTKKYLHQMFNRHRLNIFRDDPLIVPVPLSRRRLNWRGFNQAELLAQRLSKTFQISLTPSTLQRIRHTTPQVEANDRISRLENLANAFECPLPEGVRGRNVILVDDVCTTNTTLNECARVLKSAGVRHIAALVIARG